MHSKQNHKDLFLTFIICWLFVDKFPILLSTEAPYHRLQILFSPSNTTDIINKKYHCVKPHIFVIRTIICITVGINVCFMRWNKRLVGWWVSVLLRFFQLRQRAHGGRDLLAEDAHSYMARVPTPYFLEVRVCSAPVL